MSNAPASAPLASLPALLGDGNLALAEELYAQWRLQPTSLPADWQQYFAAAEREQAAAELGAPQAVDTATLRHRATVLKGWAPFADLSETDLLTLAKAARPLTLSDGDIAYRENEPGDAMYFVVNGELEVFARGQQFTTLGRGQAFGELGLFFGQTRAFSIVARGTVDVLRISRPDFDAVLAESGPLSRHLLATVTRRLADVNAKQERVDRLIRGYRVRGHVAAHLDPLSDATAQSHPELELAHYDLGPEDLDLPFSARTLSGAPLLSLRRIVGKLRNTYCGPIGVQFMHIDDHDVRDWLTTRMETSENRTVLARDTQRQIFERLAQAEVFENFLQRKFVGAKRFSLEGGESLIPLLDLALEAAADKGVREVVIGMAHRGRLNVLANIMGKPAAHIFREFEDKDAEQKIGRGDVKYHMGHASTWTTHSGHKVKLNLCFNPSHLEIVGPVAVGRTKARQDRIGGDGHKRVMPVLIHGDAAFAGQGIVQEMLNLSELHGYRVGGTLHVIVNNQIGFTTPPSSSRSSRYCTDVAKMLQAPIFHVNGEHPEGVAQVIQLAMEFRERFHRDVFIDMYCYRRHGHNEGDDPTFTQPLMYQAIRARKSVVEGYLDNLEVLGGLTRQEGQEIIFRAQQHLEEELSRARGDEVPQPEKVTPTWQHYRGGRDRDTPEVPTGVPLARLSALLHATTQVPAGFTVHPKLQRSVIATRQEMAAGGKALDWGGAEALAWATLVTEGHPVRLSGQDSGRGTFSHRHAVLHDYNSGHEHVPLQHLAEGQAPFTVLDSALSEASVLGFDYGYSLDTPQALVMWEAQFGDFSNCAQVIIDQFISSSEDKWNRLSGIVMLLPHGFEGQGPEHSSARLERYLDIAAEDNIQVVNLTTPANLFHCLRRQVHRKLRKPLVVMSPKSLLRHPEAVSSLAELADGRYQRVIADTTVDPKRCKRVLLCSGKIYYELAEARRQRKAEDVAIVRLEQLYPLSDVELGEALAGYDPSVPVLWVQEEPRNMGAWVFLHVRLGKKILGKWSMYGVTRPESASPATGSIGAHKLEQARLIDEAFTWNP
jgi:2-oxoglutarate dehydrogenase E1 component